MAIGNFPEWFKYSKMNSLYKKGCKILYFQFHYWQYSLKYPRKLGVVSKWRNHTVSFKKNNMDLGKVSQQTKPYTYSQMIFCVPLTKKMHISGTFCGLTKAFDCMNDDILLPKFNYMECKFKLNSCLNHAIMTENRNSSKSPNSNYNTYSYWGFIKQNSSRLNTWVPAFSHICQWSIPNHQVPIEAYTFCWCHYHHLHHHLTSRSWLLS